MTSHESQIITDSNVFDLTSYLNDDTQSKNSLLIHNFTLILSRCLWVDFTCLRHVYRTS